MTSGPQIVGVERRRRTHRILERRRKIAYKDWNNAINTMLPMFEDDSKSAFPALPQVLRRDRVKLDTEDIKVGEMRPGFGVFVEWEATTHFLADRLNVMAELIQVLFAELSQSWKMSSRASGAIR